jgi:hypothetical protein
MTHAVVGLNSQGLIGIYVYGDKEAIQQKFSDAPDTARAKRI